MHLKKSILDSRQTIMLAYSNEIKSHSFGQNKQLVRFGMTFGSPIKVVFSLSHAHAATHATYLQGKPREETRF